MQDAAGYVYPHDKGYDDKIGKGRKYSKWENDSVLRYCTIKRIDKLESDYFALTNETGDKLLDPEDKSKFTTRLARGLGYILKALTIRR